MTSANVLEIQKLSKPFNKKIHIPGSKSITNRALIISALAEGTSTIHNVLFSDDTLLMISALRKLGVDIEIDREKNIVVVHGKGGHVENPRETIQVGNAGTCMRFLTTMLTLGKGEFVLDGDQRMRQRPIQDLIDGLNKAGMKIQSIHGNGCPPIKIHANGMKGGIIEMKGNTSSQYFSSVLLSAPYGEKNTIVKIIGDLVSRPYVDMTISIMQDFGVDVKFVDDSTIEISNSVRYKPKDYHVESDFTSASYFMAAAAITASQVELTYLPNNSIQGDSAICKILSKMGARVTRHKNSVKVKGTGKLEAIDIDMFNFSDLMPTIAAISILAKGTTKIHNVENVRVKESDRIAAMASELRKLGVEIKEFKDGLEIHGGQNTHGNTIETYNDHRIAMAFSILGLKIDGIFIKNPNCVTKTFPTFFNILNALHR
ncbi:MAG: 3-phosphoshikimate 1-carboxyvinyltransferase [Promethearchaeota archaeon]